MIGGGGGVSKVVWRICFHKKLHYTLIIILKLFELLKYEMQSQLWASPPPLPSSRCMPAYQVINLSKMTDTYTLLYMFQWLVLCKHQNIRHKFCYYYFDLSTQKNLSKVKKVKRPFLLPCPRTTFVPIFSSIRAKIENWNLGAFKGL